jgi:hypothetical protein
MASNMRSAFGIYHVLEKILRETDQPLTCVDLFDKPDVRQFAESANRVSDYLGHMWRRDLLDRVPAPKTANSQARWAYIWKGQLGNRPVEVVPLHKKTETPTPTVNVERSAVKAQEKLLEKPNIEISQNGELVTIDLPALTITIRTK